VVDTDQDDDPFWQTRVYCDARRPVVEVPGPHRTRRFEFLLKPDETDAQVLSPECLHTLLHPFKGDAPVSIVRKTCTPFMPASPNVGRSAAYFSPAMPRI